MLSGKLKFLPITAENMFSLVSSEIEFIDMKSQNNIRTR